MCKNSSLPNTISARPVSCEMIRQRTDRLLGMVLQVTGDQLKQVLQEMRGKLTPEEGRALVVRALRDRDQMDSDKWQVL